MSAANDWLLEQGHSNDGFCQKCWDRAAWLLLSGTFTDKNEAYYAAMDEAQRLARSETEASLPVETDA